MEAGGLTSYGADYNDLHRRAAVYVDKILKGVKPADLPVEQASKYELIINLETANALGLAIPVREIFGADRFSTFTTVSDPSEAFGRQICDRPAIECGRL
jgi:ABC-type uncharacterized transport system substrate-binding protein